MVTLSDKLKSLGVKVGARDVPPPPPQPRPRYPIEEVVAGHFHPTRLGEAFVVENSYPADYRHGRASLITTASLVTIAEWADAPHLTTRNLDRFAFLDVETTGLSGGTGTYAFLIGVGRFAGDCFQLKQLFMRDPAEEPAVLAALSEFLDPLDALVTFNGKAFDAPLLRARYVMNGMRAPFEAAAHLDLLPLARRLWRDRLESRALGSLETHILGAQRTGEDIPGWLIPALYFDYVRDGDARPMKGILYHNAMDVAAMAALLGHMAQMLDQPLAFAVEHGLDLIAIARLFEDLGRLDEAATLYTRGLEYEVSEETFRETMRRLSFVHRRRGNLELAVELWRNAAHGRQVYAYVELAKYYEHRARDYSEALRQTRAALDIINARDFPRGERAKWLKELERRLERLEGKLKARLGS
ncbi:MAG: ribonuclease H-like domain-containing protein [Anaerolineae bacterium]